MTTGDFDPNQQYIYNENTGGEYIYPQDGNNWEDSPVFDVNDYKITIDNGSISNTDFMFLYKGEWVPIISVMERVEKMEKFIEAFMGTFDKGITLDKISEMRNIWNDEHDNTEDEWDIETAGAPSPEKMSITIDPNYKLPSEQNLLTNEDFEIDI